MYRCTFFILFPVLLLAACSPSKGPWLSSFVDPSYRDVAFRSVAVLADTGDYDWRKDFEYTVAAELVDQRVAAGEGSRFIVPMREWQPEQMRATLQQQGFDACLAVRSVGSRLSDEFVPQNRVTETERVPIVERVRVKEGGRWVTKDSTVGWRDVSTTRTEGGFYRQRDYRTFRIELTDLAASHVAWSAEYSAYMDALSIDAFASYIARQLVLDGIVRRQEK